MKVVVLGGGESGIGAAVLAQKQGHQVLVSDKGTISAGNKEVLLHHGIEWEEETHSMNRLLTADLVVKSPGIPDTIAPIQALTGRGIPVISEIEWAASCTEARLIGITGTNGKTTTATLTQFVLAQSGMDVALAGNIGDSFAGMVARESHPDYVLEISSFQLDGIEHFRPHVAVILNITPDHLDRYDNDFERYIAAKFRIAMNQTEDDFLVYDADDPVIVEHLANHPVRSKLMPFSLEKSLDEGAYFENETIIVKYLNNSFNMPIATLGLQGKHNAKNAMAASTVATLIGIRKETIRRSLELFQGVEHRLERVLKINQVQYINDSKATNVNATFFALDSMETPTVWIVGGVDKGNDYTELLSLVNEKVKAIICLGMENDKIIETFGNIVELMVETHSMDDAVQVAYKLADKGDSVLLSPACASFDLFKNYEDRGMQFKQAVRNL